MRNVERERERGQRERKLGPDNSKKLPRSRQGRKKRGGSSGLGRPLSLSFSFWRPEVKLLLRIILGNFFLLPSETSDPDRKKKASARCHNSNKQINSIIFISQMGVKKQINRWTVWFCGPTFIDCAAATEKEEV